MSEVFHALGRQQRVVYALLLREMRNSYGKYYLGYLWAFFVPIFRVALLTALHAFFFRSNEIYGAPPVVFFFLGVWPFLLFMQGYLRSIGSFSSYRSLYVYRTVKPVDAWLGTVVTELSIYMITLIICISVACWVGIEIVIEKPLEVMLTVAALYLLGISLGLLVETVNMRIPDVGRFAKLMRRPMFWISGLFFTIEMIPPALKPYMIWNPVLHGTDIIRGMALSEYTPQGSPTYLFLWVVGLMLLSLMYYRRHRFDMIGDNK